jgi:acyl-coenzyme A synthetase/AMP-(fatty) acid ligase
MVDRPQPVPLIPSYRPDLCLVRRADGALTQGTLLAAAQALAQDLPALTWVLNLCQDRGAFVVALGASLLRGIPCLLPPTALARGIEEVAAAYPGALCLCDAPRDDLSLPQWWVTAPAVAPAGAVVPGSAPAVDGELDSVLVFTSGSTGSPQAHPKRWADLMAGARVAGRRFGIGPETTLVATVPPQHMYGLELSVLLPLATGAAVETGRPFFPEDVRRALARVPPPRALVTTPVHLAACVESMAGGWPAVEMAISATAPLDPGLAERVERALGTCVYEIYGCTEAGSMASRRTLEGPDWLWYDTLTPRIQGQRVSVTSDFLPTEVSLSDILELDGERRFRLLGRGRDLVKIAGKRASLADLNTRLNAIPGVKEGVFVVPDEGGQGVRRLAAVAVAPGLDREQLIAALRRQVDPAFLPRPLILVERLPRNETGKLPLEHLLGLIGAGGAA